MAAVSLWTRPPALHLCAGPQKIYPTSQLSRPTAATCRCGTTATSTTRRNCTCDTTKTCRAQQRACQRRDRNCNCGSHSYLHARTTTKSLHDQHNRDIDHQMYSNRRNSWVGNCLCVMTGMTTTMMNCNCAQKAPYTDAVHVSADEPS